MAPNEREALLELLKQLGAAVLRVNPETFEVTFQGAPESPRNWLGARAGERRGFSFWRQFLPAEEHEEVLRVLGGMAQDGEARTLEHRAIAPGRGEVWVRTAGVRSESNSLSLAMLDITESRQNERQWREVEAWLVTLSETLPFDFWICDRDGRYLLQNPASLDRLGNAIGLHVKKLSLAPELREAWQRSFERALTGETVREEVETEHNGQRRCVVRVMAPVREADGLKGALGVDIDVTELKLTEERLRQSLLELKNAQQALVRRSQLEALGEMAAVVAHEVRNPLGSINNSLALLGRSRGRESGDELELWGIIQDEVDRLGRLVTNLLDFARPITPDLSPSPLDTVMEASLAATLRAEDAANRIRIAREYDPSLPPVPMDPHLLGLALTNILRNAVQAMPEEGLLEISLASEARGQQNWARITIQDSGTGIPAELHPRIFEPFFTTKPTGSGLGLTIVRRVLDEHHGEMSFSNGAPKGTRCTICLPLTDGGR